MTPSQLRSIISYEKSRIISINKLSAKQLYSTLLSNTKNNLLLNLYNGTKYICYHGNLHETNISNPFSVKHQIINFIQIRNYITCLPPLYYNSPILVTTSIVFLIQIHFLISYHRHLAFPKNQSFVLFYNLLLLFKLNVYNHRNDTVLCLNKLLRDFEKV